MCIHIEDEMPLYIESRKIAVERFGSNINCPTKMPLPNKIIDMIIDACREAESVPSLLYLATCLVTSAARVYNREVIVDSRENINLPESFCKSAERLLPIIRSMCELYREERYMDLARKSGDELGSQCIFSIIFSREEAREEDADIFSAPLGARLRAWASDAVSTIPRLDPPVRPMPA